MARVFLQLFLPDPYWLSLLIIYKVIVNYRFKSKVDFEGLIDVAQNAQKTVAQLSNKNLLLSDTAEISTKPFLEIKANDIRCTHGATVGFLDKNALFYLCSRGILENAARDMLIQAFIDEVSSNRVSTESS